MPAKDHFEGKSVVTHLKEARKKGALASAEIHGVEMSGSMAALADASKETALLLLIFWLIFHTSLTPSILTHYAILLASAWIIWKTARSALLGWSRIERLHRLIEEERWEIQHHRAQEKEELKEMYAAKGLKGKLLEETVEVLMADDNRLLKLMIEEELGLTLEAYEHPLKQAFGAFCGSCGAALLCVAGLFVWPQAGLPILVSLTLILSCIISAKLENNKAWNLIVWNLATAALIYGCVYFLTLLIIPFMKNNI